MNNRAYAVDILRGLAIVGMVLSGYIAWNPDLPACFADEYESGFIQTRWAARQRRPNVTGYTQESDAGRAAGPGQRAGYAL